MTSREKSNVYVRRIEPEAPAHAASGTALGRADERLRGHAAGVQAIAAHPVLLDQRHLRLHRRARCRRVTRPAEPPPITTRLRSKRRGLLHSRIRSARLQRFHCALCGERKDAEENERERRVASSTRTARAACRRRRRRSFRGACRAGSPNRTSVSRIGRESHRQIDHEERKHGSEPQREQIVSAFLFDACVDRFELVAEFAPGPIRAATRGT